MSTRQKYALVKRQSLTRREWVLFAFRLMLLCLGSPRVAYAYLRAQHIEGYYNPREFTQALILRLGRNAHLYSFDPLTPKPVAQVVWHLRTSDPINDVGVDDGSTDTDRGNV